VGRLNKGRGERIGYCGNGRSGWNMGCGEHGGGADDGRGDSSVKPFCVNLLPLIEIAFPTLRAEDQIDL
jgi:hypothetical protein